MQQINYKYSPTPSQKLFTEKILESLYIGTLDSYRLRLHNPKTAIEELVYVTYQVRENILQRSHYVDELKKEVTALLESGGDGLIFKNISRDYYKGLIKESAKKEKYTRIIQASKLVLKDNICYAENITNEVKQCIYDLNEDNQFNCSAKLLSLVGYALVELVNIGYTKQYLYNIVRTIFVYAGDDTFTFDERFSEFVKLFTRPESKYTVILQILSNKFQFEELSRLDKNYIQVNRKYRAVTPSSLSTQVSMFLEKNKNNKLVAFQTDAPDHFKAIEIARNKMEHDLDLYHLGFNGIRNHIGNKVAVISERDPERASVLPSNYQLEGYTRGNQQIFNLLLDKVKSLKSNNVSKESIDKLLSGFRYLRMGSESPELANQMLNFWIGLEFIFTSNSSTQKTIDRIIDYFPKCHALIYVRRNLFDLHKALGRLKLDNFIEGYSENLEYLCNVQVYDKIKTHSPIELLKYRATYLRKWVEDPSNICRRLHEHKNNLGWNISRLYRLRNEIVHTAATKSDITANVSHLKYYLTFILNSVLEFFANLPADIDNDGKITIEDYLISQEIILESLKGKTLSEYVKVDNPIEMLF